MSMPKACCTLPPVESDYQPLGNTIKVGDIDVYQTKDSTHERMLICLYDIFGFHPVTKQVCDRLALAGFRVAMPDIFRGKPWPLENFPPADFKDLLDWVKKDGNWDIVKADLAKVVEHFKAEGVKSFGIFGFCWGAKMACHSAQELSDVFGGAALVHPSFVELEDALKVKSPMLVLPTKDETDFVPFFEKLKETIGEDKCGHYRFDDMHHGFLAARGDFNNELNRQRADEGINLMATFFNKHLTN